MKINLNKVSLDKAINEALKAAAKDVIDDRVADLSWRPEEFNYHWNPAADYAANILTSEGTHFDEAEIMWFCDGYHSIYYSDINRYCTDEMLGDFLEITGPIEISSDSDLHDLKTQAIQWDAEAAIRANAEHLLVIGCMKFLCTMCDQLDDPVPGLQADQIDDLINTIIEKACSSVWFWDVSGSDFAIIVHESIAEFRGVDLYY